MLKTTCARALCLLILSVQSVYNNPSCSRNFSLSSDILESRRSVVQSDKYRFCNYAIKVQSEKQISLNFLDLPRNSLPRSLLEYVVVFDGPDCLAPRIGVAHDQQTLTIVSTGSQMTALFCSNTLGGTGQFKARYSTVSGKKGTSPVLPRNNSRILDDCGGELKEPSGKLNFSGDARTNALCIWRLKVNEGGRVRLRFTRIILGADNAWLRALDGGDCGAPMITLIDQTLTDPYLELNSNSNVMMVVYASSSGSEKAQIEARYWEERTTLPPLPSELVTETEEMANNPAISVKFSLIANSVGYALAGAIILLLAIV